MIKILILGGGFGGVTAGLDLAKKFKDRKDVQITLVDRNDSQTFTPALYEIASIYGVDHQHPFHTKLRGAICIPFKEIFKGKNIELIQAEVSHIDMERKHIVTSAGNTIEFVYLIIALGSKVSTGVPGADEYAYKFKTIEDGLMVNDKIENLYIKASQGKRDAPISILIVGAGFNGIELAAELSNCSVHIAHRHKITRQNCTAITMLEAGPTILPMIQEKNRRTIDKRMKNLGINILVNSAAEEVGPDYVKIKDGSAIKGDLIVWTAGVKALGVFKTVQGLKLDERGRILVNDHLQTQNFEDVFAVGDNVVFIDPRSQKPVPQMAFVAMEQGRAAAENISWLIKQSYADGRKLELKKYMPGYNFWIAPVGGKNAVAHLGKWGTYSGFLGYVLREAADLRYFLKILPFWKALNLFFKDIVVFSRND